MNNQTIRVINRMRQIIDERHDLHQVPGNQASVYANERGQNVLNLGAVALAVAEGVVYVTATEMKLITFPYNGDITICQHDGWQAFIDGELNYC